MQAPERRHTLALKIGGDTFEDLLHGIEQIARELTEKGTNGVSVIGGPVWGATWCHVTDDQQTHQRYFEQVNEFIKSQREGGDQ